MALDAREYLLDRFTSDATALRTRAAAVRSAPVQAGPDAQMSLRMAEACDRVVELVRSIPESEPPGIMLQSIATLTIPLEKLAQQHQAAAAVRSVYAGAALRIRELLDAEAGAE